MSHIRTVVPPTSAHVDITVAKNTSFSDAFQFDEETVTTWDFVGKTFSMSIKGNFEQAAALLTLTSGAGQIVVDNAVTRVLHFVVTHTALTTALVPGTYYYDLVMIDGAVRTQLMHGQFNFVDAVTGG